MKRRKEPKISFKRPLLFASKKGHIIPSRRRRNKPQSCFGIERKQSRGGKNFSSAFLEKKRSRKGRERRQIADHYGEERGGGRLRSPSVIVKHEKEASSDWTSGSPGETRNGVEKHLGGSRGQHTLYQKYREGWKPRNIYRSTMREREKERKGDGKRAAPVSGGGGVR